LYEDVMTNTTLAGQAAGAVDSAKEGVAAGLDNLKDRATSAMDQAKSTATSLADQASAMAGNAKDFAEARKNDGANAMHGLAGMAKDAARTIEPHVPSVARAVNSMASSVDQASRDLHKQSIDDIAANVAKFARGQPVAALATAFFAGVIITRMFSSRS
jgi:ABC-type transporter Mla subunit MlaD